MGLFHIVDKDTKLVVYADKEEIGTPEEVVTRYPDRIVVPSKTGEPNAPTIFPGFLYHEDCFWSPQRMAAQVTSGNITLDKDEFIRLFTFDELVQIYNYEDDPNLTTEVKRVLKAFLKYLEGATRFSLQHPTLISGINFFESIGYIGPDRKAEIFAVTYMQ